MKTISRALDGGFLVPIFSARRTFGILVSVMLALYSVSIFASTCVGAPEPAWKPTKPIKIIASLGPGSNVDTQARLIGAEVGRLLGVSVVVDNKPGGGGRIAINELLKAAPDGHTFMLNLASMTTVPQLYKKPPYDLFNDFTPLTTASLGGTVLVTRADSDYKTLDDVVRFAKANPGKLTIASYGMGTTSHLNIETLKSLLKTDIGHVPYAGGATPANVDLIGGRIDLYFDGPATAITNLKAGKVRILAAATERRIPAIPEVATFRELGFDLGIDGWLGFFGPAQMPCQVVQTLYSAIVLAEQSEQFKRVVLDAGLDQGGESPEAFTLRIKNDYLRWGKVIRDSAISLD